MTRTQWLPPCARFGLGWVPTRGLDNRRFPLRPIRLDHEGRGSAQCSGKDSFTTSLGTVKKLVFTQTLAGGVQNPPWPRRGVAQWSPACWSVVAKFHW
mmetsp:Transcript_86770/g.226465  ORF Transcript_86770/g.226465 Transcript_86770/m.226465 type:complete len:98 (-) Transcript_86770:144-437(-)